MQQERPDWEKNLPEYARAQMDAERRRPKTAADCWVKLEVMQLQLNRIEKLLADHLETINAHED